ncbi:hypothetical protein EDC96DRAFT_523370 [Choanephora cucurbitarum]|nr:hypothetical protein EDC96DRAFT_523370 [Choanephora cucurbitarum]
MNEPYSPQSTEELLYHYLNYPNLQEIKQEYQVLSDIQDATLYSQKDFCQSIAVRDQQQFLAVIWDNTYTCLDDGYNDNTGKIMLELNNFSDLQTALKDIEELEPHVTNPLIKKNPSQRKSKRWSTTEEDLIELSSSDFQVPPSIRLDIESSQMMDVLMDRAVKHWCCIGFKVAPISVDLIRNWRKAPQAIIYCIASITLVTFMNRQVEGNNLYSKQAAIVFYEQAKSNMDDVMVDNMQPLVVQSYFCLSYTSNLLRLYEQQRTWGGLASISLQHLTMSAQNDGSTSPSSSTNPMIKKEMNEATLGCWLRWYYIDAWMCLTLNRECLVPDTVPWLDMKQVERISLERSSTDQHQLYSFANLTYYMRKYIRVLHSGEMFVFGASQSKFPSVRYYEITQELTGWYNRLPKYSTIDELHLHLCYNSMRLVVLYQFLHPQYPPPQGILIDCLDVNLELLQALQHLKSLGCDQSTYHHMFFAIHNTAKRAFQYSIAPFKHYAEEQLKINLMLLKSTQAYVHDVFKMKIYAQKIEDQLNSMKIVIEAPNYSRGNTTVFRQSQSHSNNSSKLFNKPGPMPPAFPSLLETSTHYRNKLSSNSPQIIVFKQQVIKQNPNKKKRVT